MQNFNKGCLQKVLCYCACAVLLCLLLALESVLVVLGSGIKHVEEALSFLAYFEDTGHVSTAVAIVRSAPHSAESVFIQYLVALLTELVRSENMAHAIDAQKLPHDLRAEGITGTSRAKTELVALRIRVAPHQVSHRALMWNFTETVDDFDLVDVVNARREAAVHTKDLVRDDNGQGQVIEHVGEVVPYCRRAVLAGTFGVEAVGLCDAARLVVASN